jgi:hypothetical protein
VEPWQSAIAFWIPLIFMLVGLFGLIIPIFPGLVVIWISALFFGLVAGFGTLGTIMFILITLGMVAGSLVDNFLMGAGARVGGASWWTIAVGIIVGILGTFLLPFIGGIILAPLAILLMEYLRKRDLKLAWQATRGLLFGWGLSFLVRFAIGLFMVGAWLIWAFSIA